MKARKPLLIRRQMRESPWVIGANQQIGTFQGRGLEIALHKSNSDDFGIGKDRLRIIRAPDRSDRSIVVKEIGNKKVNNTHMM